MAAGIILAYGLLILSMIYLLWSLAVNKHPHRAGSSGSLENPPDPPLPEQLFYGALGGFLGPAIGRFLHHQRPDHSPKREAQLALLAIGTGPDDHSLGLRFFRCLRRAVVHKALIGLEHHSAMLQAVKLLMTHGYMLSSSGSNVYVQNLCRALVRAGHEVSLLCQEPRPLDYDFVGGHYTVDESKPSNFGKSGRPLQRDVARSTGRSSGNCCPSTSTTTTRAGG